MTDEPTVEENVKMLLADDPRCRDDDKWLVFQYVRHIDKIEIFIPYKDFGRMTSFESITRARRNIQNNLRMYLPTDYVQRRRDDLEKEKRGYYANRKLP